MHPDPPKRHFASDNNAGVCPEVWTALHAANSDHAPGYGDDAHTAKAQSLFRDVFETDCEAHFVFNGTAANSLVVAAACDAFHAVICHAYSHLETDESNAPGFFCHGVKTLPIDTPLAKLTPDAIERIFRNRRDIHASAPRLVSLTQASELGTLYTMAEIQALCECAHELGMFVHMDGARFANAIAALGVSPSELTWRCGIDALSFGGTKNGMLGSEAVMLFAPELRAHFKRRCKQSGQLASKMRYHAAQWIGLLEGGGLAEERRPCKPDGRPARIRPDGGPRRGDPVSAGSQCRLCCDAGNCVCRLDGTRLALLQRCRPWRNAPHVLMEHH